MDDVGISFDWAVKGWNEAAVPKEVRAGTVNLTLRVGPYPARYTTGTAKDLSVTRTTTGDGNTTVRIAGRPVQVDWTTGPLLLACLTAVVPQRFGENGGAALGHAGEMIGLGR